MIRRPRAWHLVLSIVVGVLGLILVPRAGPALVIDSRISDPQALLSLGSHEWERLPALVDEARRSPDAVVFLTQPVAPTSKSCHDCPNRPHRLVVMGVEPSRIVLLAYRVSNTRDEALAARDECVRRGIQRLLVVTSPYHTLRVGRIFDRTLAGTGISVGVIPARAYSPADPDRWWRRAYDRAYVRYEWAALIYDVVRPVTARRN